MPSQVIFQAPGEPDNLDIAASNLENGEGGERAFVFKFGVEDLSQISISVDLASNSQNV